MREAIDGQAGAKVEAVLEALLANSGRLDSEWANASMPDAPLNIRLESRCAA